MIVTHNMQQAARVSDTTSFFYMGAMVETGPTRQIFTAPSRSRPRPTSQDGSDDRDQAHGTAARRHRPGRRYSPRGPGHPRPASSRGRGAGHRGPVASTSGTGRPGQTLQGIYLRDPATGRSPRSSGPRGCGKSTFLRSVNRMNDLIPGRPARRRDCVDGESIFAPRHRPGARCGSGSGWCSSGPTRFPSRSSRTSPTGRRLNALVAARELPDLVERCLRRAALWDEVKDRLDDARPRGFRAGSSSGSASPARWATSPRSC